MADGRPEWVPDPPPNLRKSTGSDECEVCTHYVEGACARYLYRTEDGTAKLPVDDDWVCDGFAPSGRADADSDEDQPKTLADAKVRVREHFRRRRAQDNQ